MKIGSKLHTALLTTALVSLGSVAMAGGTIPGTIISNTIDLSYNSGGSTITRLNEAQVTFLVDRKIDFTFEGQDASGIVTVSQGASAQQLTFLLVNEGNDTQGFDIDVATTGTIGLTYDPTGAGLPGTYSVYLGATAAPVNATDTLYDVAGTLNIGDLAADGEIYVKILAHIPTTAVDAQADAFTVTATALDAGTNTVSVETATPDINAVDTFFADNGLDGIESDSESYLVSAPVLSAFKTSTLVSENIDGTFNCATGAVVPTAEAYVPGACLEYRLAVTNDAGATSPASTLTLTDVLPAEVTYVAIFSNTGFDSVVHSSGTITANIASLAPGATAETRIRVIID